jgi:ATP-dependent DNA helicase RecQ
VRKALSGVARMSVRGSNGFLARFGRNRVIQVLLGGQTKEILDARLNELSTYGILKQSSTKYLQELFRELEEERLIQSTGGQYPTRAARPTEYCYRLSIDLAVLFSRQDRIIVRIIL